LLALSGCGGGGFRLSDAGKDTSILTGSVEPVRPAATDPAKASDQTTIRNAVSSANLEELAGAPLAWANVVTGSRGSVFEVAEVSDAGAVCRRFKGSRQSFDGVSLFTGEACMAANGAWWMRNFEDG
jgi:hypothetical protein